MGRVGNFGGMRTRGFSEICPKISYQKSEMVKVLGLFGEGGLGVVEVREEEFEDVSLVKKSSFR